MQRRTFLGTAAAGLAAGAAGCLGLLETQSAGTPPVLDDRPDAVYFPTHVEGMDMAGRAESGDYAFALTFSYAHRFWTVSGTTVEKVAIEDSDDVHLMATVWDPETGVVLPEAGLSLSITGPDGEVGGQEVIYPMLSQPMGFHYGANFPLSGEGTYDVEVSVGGVPANRVRRTGAFRGRFADPASATVDFHYSEQRKNDISYENTPDRAGERMARDPMRMEMLPTSVYPAPGDMPGEHRGTASTGDATLEVLTLSADEASEGMLDGDGTYLAVSARTPYNRMVLPAMALSATLTRDGETVFEDSLRRTLDPDLRYHYGAAVESVESGDELELRVETPPQVARHEGYETAFVDMPTTTVSLS